MSQFKNKLGTAFTESRQKKYGGNTEKVYSARNVQKQLMFPSRTLTKQGVC